MRDVDSWSAPRGDTVHHHATDEELDGMGEREYVEHIKATSRPSVSERFLIVGALLVLGAAGYVAHMYTSTASAVDLAPVGAISDSGPSLDYCREHSPYPDKSC